jgi:hypothetical protein
MIECKYITVESKKKKASAITINCILSNGHWAIPSVATKIIVVIVTHSYMLKLKTTFKLFNKHVTWSSSPRGKNSDSWLWWDA